MLRELCGIGGATSEQMRALKRHSCARAVLWCDGGAVLHAGVAMLPKWIPMLKMSRPGTKSRVPSSRAHRQVSMLMHGGALVIARVV